MTIDEKYERELVKLQSDLEKRIARFYTILAQEIAPLISSGMQRAALERAINAKLSLLSKSIKSQVQSGITKAWHLSNSKTGAYLDKRLKGSGIPDSIKKVWYDPNEKALKQFIKGKDSGATLSERVFKQTKQAKRIISNRIKAGIGEGRSSVKIATDIRSQLVNPTGHDAPGQGVYKSPVKNTMRLARTVTNKSYRMADHEAWKKDPIVLGYEIQLSKTQSKKVKARCEICRALAGKYPVEFVFVGWHPHCLCYKTPILMNDAQMAAYRKLIAQGEDSDAAVQKVRAMKGGGLVQQVPSGFKDWVSKNQKRVEGWEKVPEWWNENEKFVKESLKRRAAPKPAPKVDYTPAGIVDYESKYGIKVNRGIFGHLKKRTVLAHRPGSGAYYSPDEELINIPFDERRSQSKWKAESVVYHEFGHASDWHNGLRQRTEVKDLMEKHKALNQDRFSELERQVDAVGFKSADDRDFDQMEQAGALSDTIMSLDKRYGRGHGMKVPYKGERVDYFDVPGYKEAEFLAHAFENTYAGNKVFERIMPDLYKDMIELILKLK